MATKKHGSRKKTLKTNGGPFRLRYFLVCDDARIEASKKLLIVGMYTDVIVVSAPDRALPQIAFVFGIERTGDLRPSTASFKLDGPEGTLIQENTFPVGNKDKRANVNNLIFHAVAMPLLEGKYTARLVVDGAYAFDGDFRVEVNPAVVTDTA